MGWIYDDKFNFNVGKNSSQIIPIFYLTSRDLLIIFGILLLTEPYLGDTSIIFSMLIYYIFINAFNYADGIDGNILSQFISILFLLMIYLSIETEIKYLLIFMIISSFIFYFSNLSNSSFKLFMGDSGSMFFGFFIIGLLMSYKLILKLSDHTFVVCFIYII